MTPYLHAQILSCLSLIEFIVVDMGGDMFKRGYESPCRKQRGIMIGLYFYFIRRKRRGTNP